MKTRDTFSSDLACGLYANFLDIAEGQLWVTQLNFEYVTQGSNTSGLPTEPLERESTILVSKE